MNETKTSAPEVVVTLDVDAYLGMLIRGELVEGRQHVREVMESGEGPYDVRRAIEHGVTPAELDDLYSQVSDFGPTTIEAPAPVIAFVLAQVARAAASMATVLDSPYHPMGGAADALAAAGRALQAVAAQSDMNIDPRETTISMSSSITSELRTFLVDSRESYDTVYRNYADRVEAMLEQMEGVDAATITGPTHILRTALACAVLAVEHDEFDPDAADYSHDTAAARIETLSDAVSLLRQIDGETDPAPVEAS